MLIILSMSNKKAQAHLDFINKYGWIIIVLVIALVVGCYFDLFNMNRYMSDDCNFVTGLSCSDYGISDGDMFFNLTNTMDSSIIILGVTVDGYNCNSDDYSRYFLEKGNSVSINLKDCNIPSSYLKQSYDININWRLVSVDIRQTSKGIMYTRSC